MADSLEAPGPGGADADTLNGWKEIAQYLGKSTRTAQRWERNYCLPVHRIAAARGEIIWASRTELDRWRTQRPALPADEGSDGHAVATIAPPAAPAGRGHQWSLAVLSCVALLPVLLAAAWWHEGTSDPRFLVTGPDTRPQGETFSLTLQGLAPGALTARWTRVPNGNVERLGAPIAADAEGRATWALTTDCQTETGEHHLWMVDGATGTSSNVLTVVVLPNRACDAPGPDLAVRGVSVDRSRVRPGDRIAVSYALWNVGTAAALPTTTRIRLGRESSRSRVTDLKLGDHQAPQLPVGGHVLQRIDVPIPASTPAGVYYVWLVADNESVGVEPNSFNNFARSQALAVGTP